MRAYDDALTTHADTRTNRTLAHPEKLHMRVPCAGSNAAFATRIRKRAHCAWNENRARRAQVPTAVLR